MTTVSTKCARGLHGFCAETRDTCACLDCHLGPCAECGATNLRKMYDDGTFCAACKRRHAHAANDQVPRTPCDVCGAVPAFRNLATRENRYLCMRHHQESGAAMIYLPKGAAR